MPDRPRGQVSYWTFSHSGIKRQAKAKKHQHRLPLGSRFLPTGEYRSGISCPRILLAACQWKFSKRLWIYGNVWISEHEWIWGNPLLFPSCVFEIYTYLHARLNIGPRPKLGRSEGKEHFIPGSSGSQGNSLTASQCGLSLDRCVHCSLVQDEMNPKVYFA